MPSVELTQAAIGDLLRLDRSVQGRVLKKLKLLERNIEAGATLGSRQMGSLVTFRKLTVGNRMWRVIYRPSEDGEIATVWVIGERSDSACYAEAVQRVESLGDDRLKRPLLEVAELLGKARPAQEG